MKYLLLISFVVCFTISKAQTCTALYSYGANFTSVHFFNQSNVANAHYYWNFGDGTGTNLKDPIHEYTENGIYLVTLYVNDTIGNCSGFYEQWLTITKNSTDLCSPSINDSIYNVGGKNYLKIIDNSDNCESYTPSYNVGSASGIAYNILGIGYYNGNFLASAYYFDSMNILKRATLKTSPNNYNRAKNYNPCSANYEMLQVSEDNFGQRVLFRAMNKNALKYEWLITDFGDPIRSNYDTISIYYPDSPNGQFPNLSHVSVLTIKEQNGCRDSLLQQVVIKSKSFTYVGISQISNETLCVNIYPNPVKNKLNLEFEPSKIRLDKLSITNTLGQIVFSLNEPQAKQEIDLSFLNIGLYFVKVQNREGLKVIKIIKE